VFFPVTARAKYSGMGRPLCGWDLKLPRPYRSFLMSRIFHKVSELGDTE
jgi:hypothetical protein